MEASKAKEWSQTRESERFPVHHSSGRGSNDKEIKEESRSLDLEEKPRPPREVPSGTTADRATKHDSQGETPTIKTEQKLPKVTPAISRKDRSRTVKVKETTTEPDQRDQLRTRSRSRSISWKTRSRWKGGNMKNWPRCTSGKCLSNSYQATQYSKC